MAAAYSAEVCDTLVARYHETRVHRPLKHGHYDPGARMVYEAVSVEDGTTLAQVHLEVVRFVGGGFAGQVYQVRVLDLHGGELPGLAVGGTYALKILIPPSGFSLFFRDALYCIGFQGPFQLQCNPAAARSGALWQKFIRIGAGLAFGDDRSVNDVHATVIDRTLGSCGEISDWVDGRTWRLEVDDRVDLLSQWRKGRDIPDSALGSPEFRAKRAFMRDFVKLLHDMGAHEFARQYEWGTCKSQPNCLKRTDTEGTPDRGLVAVDFRAGLALLPFLPMSPGDIPLILQGLLRGSLVQFDRGDVRTLERFVQERPEAFEGTAEMLEELRQAEAVYRNSVPDITHNHVRLLYSGRLWSIMLDSAVTGWEVRGLIDRDAEARLRGTVVPVLLLALVGALPFVGRPLMKLFGHATWRRHYLSMLTSPGYLMRALLARRYEAVREWHRDGRVGEDAALRVASSLPRYLLHLPLSFLPAGLHRFLTDGDRFRAKLHDMFVRPVKLYFDAPLREQWLRDMIEEGRRKYLVSDEDAEQILGSIKEPFIQKYLQSLAVHVATLPVTQVVSALVAGIYWVMHPDTPPAERSLMVGAILAAFQVVPLSPGSLTRGLYVLYLVIRERNFKDYNIAVFLGFFKYVGYLAFPIQMTNRYPALARFMAGHWATEAVHIVPVFGERGALLEHFAFTLFYNWPLTVRRRVGERMARRAGQPVRWWVAPGIGMFGGAAVASLQYGFWQVYACSPTLGSIGWGLAAISVLSGALVTASAGGAGLVRRVAYAAIAGLVVGAAFTAGGAWVDGLMIGEHFPAVADLVAGGVWRVFIATVLSPVGAVITEILLPAPSLRQLASSSS